MPAAYGYMHVPDDVPDERLRDIERRVRGYAELHGLEFVRFFHEFHYGSFRAWADLTATLRLTDARHVIVPSFDHVAHNILLCQAVLQRLTDDTRAEAHTLTTSRRAVRHHMDVPAF